MSENPTIIQAVAALNRSKWDGRDDWRIRETDSVPAIWAVWSGDGLKVQWKRISIQNTFATARNLT